MFSSGMTSRWKGVYEYPKGFAEAPVGAVPFTMTLEHGWFGAISGAIVDGEGGIPEEARGAGRIVSRSMRFTKRYAHLWVPSSDGTLVILPGVSPSPVKYAGVLSFDGSEVSGVWSIAGRSFLLEGSEMAIDSASGTWSARRLDLVPTAAGPGRPPDR